MKIKDYLRINAEKEATLKSLATFTPGPDSDFPERDLLKPSPNSSLSPFEQAIIKAILPQAGKILKSGNLHPVLVRVHLSSTCKHNCSGCLYGKDCRKDNVFMDANNFNHLLDRLHALRVQFIDISGGGEPTLHPEFDSFVQNCRKGDFELGLLSNGAWSDQGIIDLLEERFSFLRVNLDANSDEVYDRIHRPGGSNEFQKVLGNLDKIVSERKRRKSDLITGTKVSIGQTNMNFLEETVNLVKDMGVDYVQFRLKNKGSDSLLPEQIRVVNKLLMELKSRYLSFLIYGEAESEKFRNGCGLAGLHLTVNPKGEVYPCSHFIHLPAAASLGNIFTRSVENPWFGPQHRQMVEHLRESGCQAKDCRWRFYNEFVQRAIKKDPKEDFL